MERGKQIMLFTGEEVFLTKEQEAELKRDEKNKERQDNRDFIRGKSQRGKRRRVKTYD